MSVELPFAPVDTIIRGKAGELRVSAGAVTAAEKAAADDRKTLMAADFGVQQVVSRRELELPIAPIDRIARLRIDNRYRVSMDARIALADILEDYANNVANAAAILARHADRRTIQAEDIETYFQLFE
jgi:histone H3/H4